MNDFVSITQNNVIQKYKYFQFFKTILWIEFYENFKKELSRYLMISLKNLSVRTLWTFNFKLIDMIKIICIPKYRDASLGREINYCMLINVETKSKSYVIFFSLFRFWNILKKLIKDVIFFLLTFQSSQQVRIFIKCIFIVMNLQVKHETKGKLYLQNLFVYLEIYHFILNWLEHLSSWWLKAKTFSWKQ